MALPSTVTTHLWPDHKNVITGPYPKVSQVAQNTDTGAGTVQVFGNTTTEELAQSFAAPASGPLTSIELVVLAAGGIPADGVQVHLHAHDAGADHFGALLTSSEIIPAGDIITAVKTLKRFVFAIPATVESGTTYWWRIVRTGAQDTDIFYQAYGSNTNPYASGRARKLTSGSGWSDITTYDLRFKANVIQPGRYQFVVDKTSNKVRCFKSTDHVTWTEQNASSAPTISSTSTLKSISTQLFDNTVLVFVITTASRLDVFRFSLQTDTWSSSLSNTTAPTFNTNVSSTAPVMGAFRSADYIPQSSILSDYVFVNNGATESVMGTARRRIKLSRRLVSDSTWNTPYDVVGSASTPDATLPGTAVDYDLRAAIVDNLGNLQIFWTQSDTSNIKRRSFSTSNSFGTAIREIGSPVAVTSNTAAYPMGQPALFFRDPDWWIAFPYVDSGVLKVAKCKTFDIENAALWTITSVVTTTIETTNSNPAVLVSDNENGGKLYLFYTKTDGRIYYTHDTGSDLWVGEQELRPDNSKTIAALSSSIMIDGIGLSYLDTVPSPDEVRFDKADIYFLKTEYTIGTHVAIRDFGIAEQVPYFIIIDVDELAATSYAANFYTRETETDSWQHMGGLSAEAADTMAVFRFERFRYVMVEITITGGQFPSGVIGY